MSDTPASASSASHLYALFMQAPMPIAITRGPKQIYEVTNNHYREFLNGKDVIGLEMAKVIPELKGQGTMELMTKVYRTGKPYFEKEYKVQLKNSQGVLVDRYFNFMFQPIRNGGKKADGIMQVGFEVTEQVVARNHRKSFEKQKDNFVAIATHELKTPVTSIKGYTQVLQNRLNQKGDTKSAEHLLKMDAQINKLTNLIADLLDASKIQAGRLHLREEQFAFDTLVSEVVGDMQYTTDYHTLALRGSTGKTLRADRDRIGQVLNNFLSNAIKYSPHKSKILVKLSKTAAAVKVSVQDSGMGIAKSKQDQIFERFYRVSGPRSHTFPGLGLGLYISSEIVKRHGGRIWVESARGKGSTFYFTLPI